MTNRQKRVKRLAGSWLNEPMGPVAPPQAMPVVDPGLEAQVRAEFANSTKIVQARPQKVRGVSR